MSAAALSGGALVLRSRPVQLVLACYAAVLTADLVSLNPTIALGVAGLGLALILAFATPVANLVLIVFVTAIVPFDVQNRLAGGAGSAIPSDVLILAALARTALVIGDVRLTRRQRRALLAVVAFLAVVVLQFLRGLAAGHERGTTGFEGRTLFAFCTFIIALPVLAEERQRRRLLVGLLVTGIALGLWGLAQWFLGLSFAAGFGVREGVVGASNVRGQLQGGLYGFPIAVVLAFAALNSRRVTSRAVRLGLAAVIALNLASLLLTYERTFWIATAIALAVVVVKGGTRSRSRAVASTPAVVLVAIGLLLTPAPQVLVAARERLSFAGAYRSDSSFLYRILESRQVVTKIRQRPIDGHGLGDTIFYARPLDQVPTTRYDFTHDGYLWLAWKVGMPAALGLLLLIGLAISLRRRPTDDPMLDAVRSGSQACLVLLLVVNVTFPAFNTYAITAVSGLLLAFCFFEPARPRRDEAAAAPHLESVMA